MKRDQRAVLDHMICLGPKLLCKLGVVLKPPPASGEEHEPLDARADLFGLGALGSQTLPPNRNISGDSGGRSYTKLCRRSGSTN